MTLMVSAVSRSQSNRAPLGCVGTEDSSHGNASSKSAATVQGCHVNMDMTTSIECLHIIEAIAHRIKGAFWGQYMLQPSKRNL